MSTTTSRRPWRLAVATAAIAALAVVGVGAPAAFAASTIDAGAEGSITVHKHETPVSAPGDGTALPTPPPNPIEGVEFTVRQVTNVDLSTNQGWLDAQALVKAFDATAPEAGLTLGAPTSKETDAAGITTFSNLAVGLYLVEETDAPNNVVGSAPFLVSVPITNPANDNEWLYNVHVYPKNSIIGITKAVEDTDDYVAGDEVEWIITSQIPEVTGSNAESITSYRVVDDLDSRLEYVSTAVELVGGSEPLVGSDYQVIVGDNPATPAVEDANTVTVNFTPAGLTKLAANRQGEVKVTIATLVLETGVIPNDATLFASNPYSDSEVDSNVVSTCWGAVNILKIDAEDPTTKLIGATFELYSSTATDPAVADLVPVADPTKGGATVSVTTNADGEASIDLLRCGDFEDNAALSPVRSYYLVETVAPDGYELLAQPIPFTITKSDVEAYTPTTIGLDLEVKNVKKFELPLTGGSGTALIYLAGIALIVGGVVFLVIRRRTAKNHS